MKSRKNTIKRGGSADGANFSSVGLDYGAFSGKQFKSLIDEKVKLGPPAAAKVLEVPVGSVAVVPAADDRWRRTMEVQGINSILGGSKHKLRKSKKSRKSKKTKKGRGSHEGGKKKCPKHCRRKTSHTRKGLKHHKN